MSALPAAGLTNELREFKDVMLDFKDEMGEFKDEMGEYKDWSKKQIVTMNRQWGDLAMKDDTMEILNYSDVK